MKEKELREHADCSICKKPIGHTGMPLFWTVKIERHGIKLDAVQRQQGLGMQIGAQLAQVMGPDEEMTEPMMDPVEITVCEKCCTSNTCVARLAEE